MRRRRRFVGVVGAAVTAAALATLAVVVLIPGAGADAGPITPAPAFTSDVLSQDAGTDWLNAGGGLHDSRYSTLTQVDKTNVAGLKVAWKTNLGIGKKLQATISEETSPIVYNGVMYLADGADNVYALNAATGALLWKHAANLEKGSLTFLLKANRGVAIGEGKVYIGQIDGNVVAIDQLTGKTAWKVKLGRWQEGYVITSAVVYYNGKIIAGVSGGDWGASSFAASVDAKTGMLQWKWLVNARPGDVGGSTWSPADLSSGGGAIWISPSIDPVTGLVYVVTGNPIPWNGRDEGWNLWTDSIVALHNENGQIAWGYQTVHHDIWDYDVTNPPVLFDLEYHGVLRTAIAVASKTAWVYILDRQTGEPLLGIPEKKVPQLKGAAAKYANLAKTQPFPIGEPFANQCSSRKYFPKPGLDGKAIKVGCIFTPYAPTAQGSFVASAPSAEGGVDWPMSAYSEQTKLLYLCGRDGQGSVIGAIPKNQIKIIPGQLSLGVNFGPSSTVQPDFGRVVAMDMRTNKIAWNVKWPQPCFSGMMATAGGLVFAGQSLIPAKKGVAASPGTLTAFDALTGKVLWNSQKLEASPNSPAITYSANGKQYVAVLAGGAGGGKTGDAVYGFALP